MAYTGYNVPDNAEKEEEGKKRERNLFHHTTHSRSICRCDPEPKRNNGRLYMFPSILVRSVWTKIGSILGQL